MSAMHCSTSSWKRTIFQEFRLRFRFVDDEQGEVFARVSPGVEKRDDEESSFRTVGFRIGAEDIDLRSISSLRVRFFKMGFMGKWGESGGAEFLRGSASDGWLRSQVQKPG